MSDSPKCLNCLKLGNVGQTYRMTGSANFQCHDCYKVYRMNEFEPIAFEWRANKPEWLQFIKANGVKV